MAHKILVVDDEKNMRELLKDLLEMEGFSAVTAADGETALGMVKDESPDVMVLDLRLPGIQGMEVLKTLRSGGNKLPVIIITAHGDINTAVDALKAGAADFIVKPFDNAQIVAAIRQALEAQRVVAEAGLSRPRITGELPEMVGKSREIEDVFELIEKIAGTTATVLISGESGTGKELVARAIHLKSDRRDGPMICINCAALPETLLESELFGYERGAFTGAHNKKAGKVELADHGTLFLDEVADLSMSAQAKLLRVLEEKEFSPLGSTRSVKVDIRIVAATNHNVENMVEAGTFRKDLFFRLNVVPVFLPPLRERKNDVPILCQHFLSKFRRRHNKPEAELDQKAMEGLCSHSWPGNVRELEHAIEKFVILDELPIPQITGVPASTKSARNKQGKPTLKGSLKESLKCSEREIIIDTLRQTQGNKMQAAKLLKVSYKTLFNKIHEHGIEFNTKIE